MKAKRLFYLILLLIFPLGQAQAYQTVEYTSAGQRDPFGTPSFMFRVPPPVYKEETVVPEGPVVMEFDLTSLQIEGMIWGGRVPQAIINGQVVTVGDIIEGAKIVDIRKEGIFLLYGGQEYILRPRMQ